MTKELTPEQKKRRVAERDIYNRSMALQLKGMFPLLTVKVYRDASRRRKNEAKKRYPNSPKARGYNEAGYLSEYAFHKLLYSNRIIPDGWTAYSEVPPDFTLPDGTTIGVTSARHRMLLNFEKDPGIHYPIRRLAEPNKLPDYVLGTSVFNLKSGETLVAHWGLIERERLKVVMREKWGGKPVPTGGNDYVTIPLVEFQHKRLIDLIPGLKHDLSARVIRGY